MAGSDVFQQRVLSACDWLVAVVQADHLAEREQVRVGDDLAGVGAPGPVPRAVVAEFIRAVPVPSQVHAFVLALPPLVLFLGSHKSSLRRLELLRQQVLLRRHQDEGRGYW